MSIILSNHLTRCAIGALIEGGKLVIEIGGKGKGREQFKDFKMENKIRFLHSDETEGNKRPLFMLGYLA